jgi:hypothetical protein
MGRIEKFKDFFRSHISSIESMLDRKEREGYGLNKVSVTYDYFLKEYTDVDAFNYLGSPNLYRIRKKVHNLKKELEDKGYHVELDKGYGLQLTVTKDILNESKIGKSYIYFNDLKKKLKDETFYWIKIPDDTGQSYNTLIAFFDEGEFYIGVQILENGRDYKWKYKISQFFYTISYIGPEVGQLPSSSSFIEVKKELKDKEDTYDYRKQNKKREDAIKKMRKGIGLKLV